MSDFHVCNECGHEEDMRPMTEPICNKCGSTMYTKRLTEIVELHKKLTRLLRK